MSDYRQKGAMNILQDTQLSIWNAFDFIFHYPIITRFLTAATAWGGKWNIMVKLAVWIFYLIVLWVPLCLGWRYMTFFFASIFRLITNKGGRKGLWTSVGYVGIYLALIPLVYIPFVFPYFGYVTAETILEYLKII